MNELGIQNESSYSVRLKDCTEAKRTTGFNNAYDECEIGRNENSNFFTNRFYNAFDLEVDYTPCCNAYWYKSPYTMPGVHTDYVQIAGRFRNGLSTLTHIYTTDNNLPIAIRKKSEYTSFVQEHAYNTIRHYITVQRQAENAFAEKPCVHFHSTQDALSKWKEKLFCHW